MKGEHIKMFQVGRFCYIYNTVEHMVATDYLKVYADLKMNNF